MQDELDVVSYGDDVYVCEGFRWRPGVFSQRLDGCADASGSATWVTH